MHSLRFGSTLALAVVLAAGLADSASAQTTPDPKARCSQLLSYYDRFGASRGENSDGARDMTRIGAGIDCERGQYEKGIASMEALLRQKHFDVPAEPSAIAQTPAPLKPHGELRHSPQ